MRAMAVAVASALLAGCPAHLERNAPGIVDVMKPPADVSREQVEPPGDPGEKVALLGVGGFGGAGIRLGSDDLFAAEAGVEVSLHWGQLEHSHIKGQPLLPIPPVVLPDKRVGVNVGWIIYEPDPDDTDRSELGPIYVEWLQADRLWSWSAGYSYDPQDESHGPQISMSGFGYYMKASYRFERGADFIIGAVIKLPQTFVWSR